MWKFSYSLHANSDMTRGQITKNRRLMAKYHTFQDAEGQLPREPKSSSFVSYGGVALALLSGVISSIITSIPKYFVNIPPLEHALLRSMGIVVFSLPPLLYHQEVAIIPQRKDWPVLFLRGILFYVTNAFRIITVHSLEISEVGVLMAIFPVYVSIFMNHLQFDKRRDPCGSIHGLSLVINLVGVGFVTNLPQVLTETRSSANFMTDSALGVTSSLAAGLSFTLAGLLAARTKHMPNRAVIFHSGIPGTLAGSLFIAMTGELKLPDCGRDSALMIVLIILVVCETVIQVYALKMEEKGPVSLCSSAALIGSSCAWQRLYSTVTLKWYTVAGIVMVLGSALLTYVHFFIISLPENSPFKRKPTLFDAAQKIRKDQLEKQ